MPRKPTEYVTDPADGLPARVVQTWSERKHYYTRRYMDIFAKGMKRWPARAYVDLFAGPGMCFLTESNIFVQGSPLISLSYPFTSRVFVEKDADAADALRTRIRTRGAAASVIHGDCNQVVAEVRRHLPERGLSLAFVDPTNWQVRFSTISELVKDRRVDLIVTFMAGMMKRVPVTAGSTQLDEFLGTDKWRQLPRRTLFAFVQLYREQLATLGYIAQAPKVEIVVRNRKRAPLYQLAFFSRDAKGYEFWDKIALVDEQGQRALFG